MPTTRVTVRIATSDGPAELVMAGLDAEHYDVLLSAYPDPGGVAPFEEDTFGPALIAACLYEPVVDEFEVGQWWESWPPDAVEELFVTALQLCAPGSVEWALTRLRTDPRFAAEMGYCGPRGIAHDAFLGWSRASQDKAIAWSIQAGDVCPGCGVPARLMDDAGALEVRQRRCVHCEVLGQVEDGIPPEHRRAIHTSLVPTPPAAPEGPGRAL